MNSNRYKYFRWTPRTARLTFIWVAVVPGLVGYLAYKTDVSREPHRPHLILFYLQLADTAQTQGLWDFRAKRRGDLLVER